LVLFEFDLESSMNEPIDTSKLDPATLAKHLGNPEGEIGKAEKGVGRQGQTCG
jgi:hypothetical protein